MKKRQKENRSVVKRDIVMEEEGEKKQIDDAHLIQS
ncbi:uncharacterized protein G2W53_032974 [Senna tora]|uniref:Uncharacterized protein n=1 Tax=Senna tora TaxID=362788 RepID=A0A834W843_9FABA|nr:uncharacterized protein G2W53_032974 [Senna tora]